MRGSRSARSRRRPSATSASRPARRPVAAGGRAVHGEDEHEGGQPEHPEDEQRQAGPGGAEEDAREGRRREHGRRLDPARRDVRGGELDRGAGERRHERVLRRADQRARGRRARRQGVDDQRVGVREQRRGSREHGHTVREVREREHATGPVPVAQHRRERRQQGRRDELRERDDPGGRGAALVVRVDDDRDPRSPLERDEGRERGHHPPQLAVAEHEREHGGDAAQVRPELPEAAAHRRGSRSWNACRTARSSDVDSLMANASERSGRTTTRRGVRAVTVAIRG